MKGAIYFFGKKKGRERERERERLLWSHVTYAENRRMALKLHPS